MIKMKEVLKTYTFKNYISKIELLAHVNYSDTTTTFFLKKTLKERSVNYINSFIQFQDINSI